MKIGNVPWSAVRAGRNPSGTACKSFEPDDRIIFRAQLIRESIGDQ